MPLTLTLRSTDSISIDLKDVLPTALRELSLREVERMPIWRGNRQVALAELFRLDGSAEDGCLSLQGELAHAHRVGDGMSEGVIRVHGNVGRHAGEAMRGGELIIDGNAGDYLGAAMHGGRIRVHGSAGDLVASALPGVTRGMTGGTILIDGDAGDETGRSMRRGLVAIGGDCGDAAGAYMRAGTLLVFGRCGIRPGLGMIRGTIGLFGAPPPLLPTFQYGCRYRPQFMPLVLRSIRDRGFAFDEQHRDCEFELHHGDLLEGGRGEILLKC